MIQFYQETFFNAFLIGALFCFIRLLYVRIMQNFLLNDKIKSPLISGIYSEKHLFFELTVLLFTFTFYPLIPLLILIYLYRKNQQINEKERNFKQVLQRAFEKEKNTSK